MTFLLRVLYYVLIINMTHKYDNIKFKNPKYEYYFGNQKEKFGDSVRVSVRN